MLRHAGGLVTHQDGQGFDVHPVDDRIGPERMPKAVEFGVHRNPLTISAPLES